MKKLLRWFLVWVMLLASYQPMGISGQEVSLKDAVKSMLLSLNQTEFIEGNLQANLDFSQGQDSLSAELESPVQFQAVPKQALLLDVTLDGAIEGGSQSDLLGNLGLLFDDDALFYRIDITQPENESYDWQAIALNQYGLTWPQTNQEDLPASIDQALTSELFSLYEKQMTLETVNDGYKLTLDLLQSEEEIEQIMDLLNSNMNENSWLIGENLVYFAQILAMFDLHVTTDWHLSQDFFPYQIEIFAEADSSETSSPSESTNMNFHLTLALEAVDSSPLVLPESLATKIPSKDFDQTYEMLKEFMDAYSDAMSEGEMLMSQAENILGPAVSTEGTNIYSYLYPLSEFEYNMSLFPSYSYDEEEIKIQSFSGSLSKAIDSDADKPIATSNEDRLATLTSMIDDASSLPDFETVDANFSDYRINLLPGTIFYIDPKTGEGLAYLWENKQLWGYSIQEANSAFNAYEKSDMTLSEIDNYLSQSQVTIQEVIDSYGDKWTGMINYETFEVAFQWTFLVNNFPAQIIVNVDEDFNVIDYNAYGFNE